MCSLLNVLCKLINNNEMNKNNTHLPKSDVLGLVVAQGRKHYFSKIMETFVVASCSTTHYERLIELSNQRKHKEHVYFYFNFKLIGSMKLMLLTVKCH